MSSTTNRFALLDADDMRKLGEMSKNKNTKRSTNTWIKVFQDWAMSRGKNEHLERNR